MLYCPLQNLRENRKEIHVQMTSAQDDLLFEVRYPRWQYLLTPEMQVSFPMDLNIFLE